MKEIKLSGRERTVLRYIDWATGTKGSELIDTTRLEAEDLVSVLNGLLEVGYIETEPYAEQTDEATYRETIFEVNPSYALELKAAMARL
jgi:DNA-binding MarR family transcriptional regulator